MLKPERYKKIIAFVNEWGTATVENLAEVTQVSKATIRRDMVELAREKAILRTHGGAMVYHQVSAEELPIEVRRQMHREEKELVAEAAAALIREGSTIYIGAGTTGRALAAKLGEFHSLTVLTNDLDVAREVAVTDNMLMVAGGQLKRDSWTLYGFFTEQMLQELQVDTAFMIVDAVDVGNGFMDYGVDEVSLKRMVIHNAKRCVMLCNAAKFEISAFVNVCPLSAVQAVVTNAEADQEDVKALQEAGIQVFQAQKKKQIKP